MSIPSTAPLVEQHCPNDKVLYLVACNSDSKQGIIAWRQRYLDNPSLVARAPSRVCASVVVLQWLSEA
jgi:hypothetical protein